MLAPPDRPNRSYTCASAFAGFATASAMRPGDGLTITMTTGSTFVQFEATEPANGTRRENRVVLCIPRDGVPAVIAELQRLTLASEVES